MVLEMRRALEKLEKGDSQGYRKMFDAVYDEVYSRSFLIVQEEETTRKFMKDFFVELFGIADEAREASNLEKWLWQKFYAKMRRQYQKISEVQKKPEPGVKALAEIPSELPLLHRILLVMSCMDDFTPSEISKIYGLEANRVQEELKKLDRLFLTLVKDQPESVSAYLGNWKVLLMGACRQIMSTGLGDWVDTVYEEAAREAGVQDMEEEKPFDYFVAEPDLSVVKPKKKPAPAAEPEEEEPEEDDNEDDEDDEEEDDEDDTEEDDDRYDWDLEDDNRRMIIIGVLIALAVVAVVTFCAYKLLNKDDKEPTAPVETEQNAEDDDASLIIKGEGADESKDHAEGEEEPSEEKPEEEQPSEEQPAEESQPEEGEQPDENQEEESAAVTMQVINVSSRVNVRSEASTSGQVVTKLKPGEKVEIMGDSSQEWVQVRCIEQDGQEGYMKSEYLKAVE